MQNLGIIYRYHLCGGWGDRIKGAINTIVLCKLLHKNFFVKWDEVDNLNELLVFDDYDYYKHYSSRQQPGNALTIINYLDKKSLKLYDLIRYSKKEDIFDSVNTSSLGIYTNQITALGLLNNSNISIDIDDFKNIFFNTAEEFYTKYFIPKPLIMDKVNNVTKNHNNIIGIQIRCGDFWLLDKKHPQICIATHEEMISIISKIKAHIDTEYSNYSIFITSDYYKVIDFAKSIFKNTDVLYYDKLPVHCDMNTNAENKTCSNKVDTSNLDKILVDHIILAKKIKRLYLSGSNFGGTAGLMNKDCSYYMLNLTPLDRYDLLLNKNIMRS